MNKPETARMRRSRAQPPAGASYRVGQLSKLCGVSAQTIRFYVNEQLLPPPLKTARNMGWYSDTHVHLLELIQRLQRERFLPLKTIRALVQANDGLVFTGDDQERLDRLRARLESDKTPKAPPPADSLLSAQVAALTERERTALRALDRGSDSKGGEPDGAIARLWVAIRDAVGGEAGYSADLLGHISDLVDRAVKIELKILGERFRSISPEEAEKILDVVVPGLNHIFGLMHQRRVARYFGPSSRSPRPASAEAPDRRIAGPKGAQLGRSPERVKPARTAGS